MKSRVTIGMPVRNAAAHLRQAINSILAQDFQDFTLLISDNASTDETLEICRSYEKQDSRVHLFFRDRDIGASANFTFVLSHAESEFFSWHAHDDWRAENWLSTLITALDRQTDAIAAVCNITVKHEAGQTSVYQFFASPPITQSN